MRLSLRRFLIYVNDPRFCRKGQAVIISRAGYTPGMLTDPWFYAVAIPAVLLSAVGKGAFGGGTGVLSVPLMSLVMPPLQAAAIMLPLLCASDLFVVWTYRKTWDRANMRIILPAGIVGVLLGTLTAGLLSDHAIKMIIGVIAIVFALDHWFGRRNAPATPINWKKGSVCSVIAAYTSFLAHAGSPPLNMYLLPQRLEKTLFVGTLVIYWAIINYAKVIPYMLLGQFDRPTLLAALVLMPVAPLGIWLGAWITRRLPAQLFFNTCYGLVFMVGLKLLWDGATGIIG